ncbi:heme peroxidase [Zopfia rhizophila CBS 207.26]|uniref:Heme peroxidase n=1 Tax=Zopfia rhizophila CBS 207.26 TaxID=1314779 RepID=A0A6A6D9W3_9PEZI|nr:heme peroxidase [Zopfia rhizophila CBS 207.26]
MADTQKNHVDTRIGATPPKPDDLSELDKLRKAIGGPFKQFASLFSMVTRPARHGNGDGSELKPEEEDSWVKEALEDLSHLGISDVNTLMKIVTQKMEGKMTRALTNDKDYLIEGMIKVAAKLPDGSRGRDKLTSKFLTQIWDDLQHPPLSYLGKKYQYRSADGSTVEPEYMQTPARPDPGVVFDSVMTHDYSQSMTSSYLDLAPLYGNNQKEQDLMRTKVDGKLKPDCFSEARLLFLPPGVGPMAPQDLQDQKAKNTYKEKLAKYDEALFQTSRLITYRLYINIILIDYVRTILNLNCIDSNWQLNSRAIIKDGLSIDWDPKTVNKYEFLKKLNEIYKVTLLEPERRKFTYLTCRANRSLPNNSLIKILTASIKDCVNSFGPNRVPTIIRHLYDHPDKVKIYLSIIIKDVKNAYVLGLGLYYLFTVSRAALADTVTLVRGDM